MDAQDDATFEAAFYRRLQSPVYQKAMQEIAGMDEMGNPSRTRRLLENLYAGAGQQAGVDRTSAVRSAIDKAKRDMAAKTMQQNLDTGRMRLDIGKSRLDNQRYGLATAMQDAQAGSKDSTLAAILSGAGVVAQGLVGAQNLGLKRKLAGQMQNKADAYRVLLPQG